MVSEFFYILIPSTNVFVMFSFEATDKFKNLKFSKVTVMMIPGWTTLRSQQHHPNYLIRLPFHQIRASKKSSGPPGFSDLFTYFVTDT